MRWAICLSTLDLSRLIADADQTKWQNLQYEFEAFVTFGFEAPFEQLRVKDGPTYGQQTIEPVRAWLYRNLPSVVDSRLLEYQRPAELSHVFEPPEGALSGLGVSGMDLGKSSIVCHVKTAFGECPPLMYELILRHWSNLCRCSAQDCRTIFLRDRRDQVFCSKLCRWRVTTRKARKTPIERYRKPGRPRIGSIKVVSPEMEDKKKKTIRPRRRARVSRTHKGGRRYGKKG
jgi:hypothetical protein